MRVVTHGPHQGEGCHRQDRLCARGGTCAGLRPRHRALGARLVALRLDPWPGFSPCVARFLGCGANSAILAYPAIQAYLPSRRISIALAVTKGRAGGSHRGQLQRGTVPDDLGVPDTGSPGAVLTAGTLRYPPVPKTDRDCLLDVTARVGETRCRCPPQRQQSISAARFS